MKIPMNRTAQKMQCQRRGFTLVELVVVVLVLGIIAAVASPKMFDTTSDARDNSTRTTLSVMRDAIELYKAEVGAYPGDAGTDVDFKADIAPSVSGEHIASRRSGRFGHRRIRRWSTAYRPRQSDRLVVRQNNRRVHHQ